MHGITLIALVVTIVVLIILAGVTINTVFSENGIIKKAREATEKTEQAIIKEQEELNELYKILDEELATNNVKLSYITAEYQDPIKENATIPKKNTIFFRYKCTSSNFKVWAHYEDGSKKVVNNVKIDKEGISPEEEGLIPGQNFIVKVRYEERDVTKTISITLKVSGEQHSGGAEGKF